MIHFILAVVSFCLFVYVVLKWATKNHEVFEKQGIKHLKPYPFIGNSDYVFRGRGMSDRILELYNGYPNEKIVGMFDFSQPLYFLRSPDLVKQLTVKDFSYFQDHNLFIDAESDPLFGNMLFAMSGKEWRSMRYSLSPIFTGKKMRMMFELIVKCAKQFTDFIAEEHEKKGLQTYGLKNIFSRYTNDAISTCAFGVECDSLRYPNNEIFLMAQKLLVFQKPTIAAAKLMMFRLFPALARIFGLKMVNKKTENMFRKIIIDTMDVRKKEGIVRPDLLHLLMSFRDGKLKEEEYENQNDNNDDHNTLKGDIKRTWTEMEIMSQCFIFFLAGFDGGSNVMIYLSYELAMNPDVQEKLIQTIDETNEELNGRPLTYEKLQSVKYLEMVILEALRKWPPALVADRKCVQTYNYEDEDGLKFTIEKGNIIWVPIYGFHMDPNYYPNPEKFDPERFSEENKPKMDPYTFLPFGCGPRNCIGLRFAIMEIKVLLYYLFLTCKVSVCQETQIPLKFKGSPFGFVPEKEVKLHIEPRNVKKFA